MLHLIALLPFLASAQAFFVLTQPILLTTRLDPIVDAGMVGGHVHSIAGGSNFDKTMSYESTQESICTTAPVTVDKSNYWVPQMYYYNPETMGYQAIPAAYINTYYLPRGGTNDTITAFPDGLRMVSGDPFRRTFDADDLDSQAISYVCLDYAGGHQGDPAWDQRNNFFEHNCPDGLRAQVNFRTCWDGVNLDSEDHRSHMAWPTNGNSNGGGDCPASHPVKVVELFYEWIFEVQNFPFNPAGTPTWVFANGDATGYGLHADFVNGWPSLVDGTNVLQRAIDECNDNNGVGGVLTDCPPFLPYLNDAQAQSCRPENLQVDEDIGFDRELARLPGDNPLWLGDIEKPTTPGYVEGEPQYTDFKSILPANWAYVGCIAEAVNGRALEAYTFSARNMTRAVCAAACGARGFALSGTQYASECYCDSEMRNSASNTTLLGPEKCDLRCEGNPNDDCGGYRTLDLFVNPTLFNVVAVEQPNPSVATGVEGWFKKERNCVAEPANARALTGFSLQNNQMTPEMCITACQARGFKFAGIEYSTECYCGSSDSLAREAPSSQCNMACPGARGEACGGPGRLSMYYSNITAPSTPLVWNYRGCHTESIAARAVQGAYKTTSNMDSEVCRAFAVEQGHTWAALVYGSECFTGYSLTPSSGVTNESECNFACSGAAGEMCGGSGRASVFQLGGPAAAARVPFAASSSVSAAASATTSSASASSASSTEAATSVASPASSSATPSSVASTAAASTAAPAAASESSASSASSAVAESSSAAEPTSSSTPTQASSSAAAASSSDSAAPIPTSSSELPVAASASDAAPSTTPTVIRRGVTGRRTRK